MSRRSHIVRTEAAAGLGEPRTLGGGGATEIYCYVVEGTSLSIGLMGPIPLVATSDYQRIFVSATIGAVHADDVSGGDDTWTVTFRHTAPVAGGYHSDPYDPTLIGLVSLQKIEWNGVKPGDPAANTHIGELDSFGVYVERFDFLTSMGTDFRADALLKPIRLDIDESDETVEVVLTLTSPNGTGAEDVVIDS